MSSIIYLSNLDKFYPKKKSPAQSGAKSYLRLLAALRSRSAAFSAAAFAFSSTSAA